MKTEYKLSTAQLSDGHWRCRAFTADWVCIFTTYSTERAVGIMECERAIGEHRQQMAKAVQA